MRLSVPPESSPPGTPDAGAEEVDRPGGEGRRQRADRVQQGRRLPTRSLEPAATSTPPANPIIASIRRRGADRKNSTGSVPMAVSRYVPIVATRACRIGPNSRNNSSIVSFAYSSIHSLHSPRRRGPPRKGVPPDLVGVYVTVSRRSRRFFHIHRPRSTNNANNFAERAEKSPRRAIVE